MKKVGITMIVLILSISIVFAEYGHNANDIIPGTFQDERYTFPRSIYVGNLEYGDGGIVGYSENAAISGYSKNSLGVYGNSVNGIGVSGYSQEREGMNAYSQTQEGIRATSVADYGVYGETLGSNMAGVYGEGTNGYGVKGVGKTYGIWGKGTYGGVYAWSTDESGVGIEAHGNTAIFALGEEYGVYANGGDTGISATGEKYGIYVTHSPDKDTYDLGGGYSNPTEGIHVSSEGKYGISTFVDTPNPSDASKEGNCALKAKNMKNSKAGYVGCLNHAGVFYGDVYISGTCSGGSTCDADVAENFKQTETLEAGDVVVIDPKGEYKSLTKSTKAYDKLVAGVVSTNPTMIMGEQENGAPLALAGVVPTKVSTENGAIEVGDLLTTSSTPGYAMKCTDDLKCSLSLVGRALEPLHEGTGVVKVLIE